MRCCAVASPDILGGSAGEDDNEDEDDVENADAIVDGEEGGGRESAIQDLESWQQDISD